MAAADEKIALDVVLPATVVGRDTGQRVVSPHRRTECHTGRKQTATDTVMWDSATFVGASLGVRRPCWGTQVQATAGTRAGRRRVVAGSGAGSDAGSGYASVSAAYCPDSAGTGCCRGRPWWKRRTRLREERDSSAVPGGSAQALGCFIGVASTAAAVRGEIGDRLWRHESRRRLS